MRRSRSCYARFVCVCLVSYPCALDSVELLADFAGLVWNQYPYTNSQECWLQSCFRFRVPFFVFCFALSSFLCTWLVSHHCVLGAVEILVLFKKIASGRYHSLNSGKCWFQALFLFHVTFFAFCLALSSFVCSCLVSRHCSPGVIASLLNSQQLV